MCHRRQGHLVSRGDRPMVHGEGGTDESVCRRSQRCRGQDPSRQRRRCTRATDPLRELDQVDEVAGVPRGRRSPARCWRRARGARASVRTASADPERARRSLVTSLMDLVPHADEKGVPLILEATNRYETSVANTLADAAAIVEEVLEASDAPAERGNGILQILPDTFHMNIEEDEMAEALRGAASAPGPCGAPARGGRPPRRRSCGRPPPACGGQPAGAASGGSPAAWWCSGRRPGRRHRRRLRCLRPVHRAA